MFSVLLFCVVVASASSVDIRSNTAPDYIGDYKLVFAWPKPSQEVPNCSYAIYSHMTFVDIIKNMSCDCGRKDANIVLLKQNTKFVGMPIVFDIVKDFDEASRALNDSCRCQPLNFSRVVAMKLNDNLMLQYEQEEILRHYIFAKVVPSESELREVVSTLKDLKYEDGQCAKKEAILNNKNV